MAGQHRQAGEFTPLAAPISSHSDLGGGGEAVQFYLFLAYGVGRGPNAPQAFVTSVRRGPARHRFLPLQCRIGRLLGQQHEAYGRLQDNWLALLFVPGLGQGADAISA